MILWGGQGEVNVPFASSYIETAGSPVIRATESMTFPFDVGMQEATFYARFRERGAIIADSGLRLMQIAASNPSLHIRAETGWRVRHTDGAAASVESTSAALPAINDVVELRAVLNADGSVQMHQSINSGTEASGSASAAQALATDKKWGSAILSVSLVGTPGYFNLIDLMSVAGVHSLGDCRKATQQ